jgi:hypothetical protein
MILSIAALILALYILLREYAPVVVYVDEGFPLKPVKGQVGLYELRASQKVAVPSYNWRVVPTGVMVAPFGTFVCCGRRVSLFGQVGCRVYSTKEIKMAGVDVLPYVYNEVPHKTIELVLTNLNPKFPVIARKGQVVAYLEVFRTPSYRLVHIERVPTTLSEEEEKEVLDVVS